MLRPFLYKCLPCRLFPTCRLFAVGVTGVLSVLPHPSRATFCELVAFSEGFAKPAVRHQLASSVNLFVHWSSRSFYFNICCICIVKTWVIKSIDSYVVSVSALVTTCRTSTMMSRCLSWWQPVSWTHTGRQVQSWLPTKNENEIFRLVSSNENIDTFRDPRSVVGQVWNKLMSPLEASNRRKFQALRKWG